ncbi:MAG: hypothetical protein PHR16_11020 [Methylovulum sp.]|nr:hypothetical protein [Methylovulum sp.]
MKHFKAVKKMALYSVAAVMGMAGTSAFAHTGIRDVVQENVAGYNAFTITHGCNDNVELGSHQDIIAMSTVFPNAADPAMAKIYKLTSTGIQGESVPDLSDDIVGVLPGVGFTKLGVGLVSGGGTLFANFLPTLDSTTAIRGYHTWAGPAPYSSAPLAEQVTSATGLSPFRYGAIQFQTTSCAKSLKVRIAVANWCRRGNRTKDLGDRLDVWMGHTTPVFHDQRTMPRAAPYDASVEVPYWPTMTIARDLVANPLTAACNGGYDLSIEPADADIDTFLPIPGGQYPAGAPGAKFFP